MSEERKKFREILNEIRREKKAEKSKRFDRLPDGIKQLLMKAAKIEKERRDLSLVDLEWREIQALYEAAKRLKDHADKAFAYLATTRLVDEE